MGERVLGVFLGVLVLAALAYGAVQMAGSAAQEGRCRDLATSDHRSDYLSFELEGCRSASGRSLAEGES